MVLKPLSKTELEIIFDETSKKVIEFYLKRALLAQPERIDNQSILPIQIPKEHLEQYIVQAIGATPVGAGSYGVDIIKENDFGADIKMLSCKLKDGKLTNADSGETSLAQNFKDTGTSLDQLFKTKDYTTIIDGWKQIIINKLQKVLFEHSVDKIYYLFILRASSTFYLCGLKVNLEEIENICPLILNPGTNKEHVKASDSSLYLDNYIDSNLGNVKIYKSKKRLELRLKPKYWVDKNYVLEFPLNFETPKLNARKLISDKKELDYVIKLIKNLYN